MGDCKLQRFHAATQQKQKAKRSTYHRANKFVPVCQKNGKAYVRKVGGRRDHVVFILIASEMQHGVADYGELTAQLPDETFATGKPPASSRVR